MSTKPTATQRIINLFTDIEKDNTKRDTNFETIKDIIDNMLSKKKNIVNTPKNMVADELKIIYDSVIQSDPELKGFADDFFREYYEKESYFIPMDDYGSDEEMGGGRKSKKSKKSKKSRKSKKSKKSRRTRKY
jgi:hypothetical protein